MEGTGTAGCSYSVRSLGRILQEKELPGKQKAALTRVQNAMRGSQEAFVEIHAGVSSRED